MGSPDIEGLAALSEAATPGPWETWKMPDPGRDRHQMTGIAQVGNEMGHRAEAMFPEDAEFVVAAVNYVRDMLAARADAHAAAARDQSTEDLIQTLLDQARQGDEAVSELVRLRLTLVATARDARRRERERIAERLDALVTAEVQRLGGTTEVHADPMLNNWVGGLRTAARSARGES